MYKNKTFLAIIPARGGSKRLPRKNILDLAGKPLIAWTIEAALKSKYIDRVVVSTDDDEIADISKKYGADVPFMRPAELATDESTSVGVVLHALDVLKENNDNYNYIILLQPTSPLRSAEDIDKAIELLKVSKIDAVISVCKTEHSPLWSNTIPDNGDLSNFLDDTILNKRSQDLDQYYRLNGAIYLCNIQSLMKQNTFFLNKKVQSFVMERGVSIDIDDDIDFQFTQFMVNNNQGGFNAE